MGNLTDTIRRRVRAGSPVLLIAGINLAVYVACAVASLCGVDPSRWLSLPSSAAQALHRPWTVFTYMVTQYSFLHLLFNMLWFWWFAQIYALTAPERRIYWIYLIGGLSGAAFYLAAGAIVSDGGMLCGSSAAVLALMTLAALRSPDYPIRLFLIGTLRLKWLALAVILLSLVGYGGLQGGVSAHLGGILAGVVIRFWPAVRKRFQTRSASPAQPAARAPHRFRKAVESVREDREALDILLDKISLSGYESLTSRERRELNRISRRLKKENS